MNGNSSKRVTDLSQAFLSSQLEIGMNPKVTLHTYTIGQRTEFRIPIR